MKKQIENLIEYMELVKSPLYETFVFAPGKEGSLGKEATTWDSWRKFKPLVTEILNPTTKLDYYCPKCNELRVFQPIGSLFHQYSSAKKFNAFGLHEEGIILNEFECAYNETHIMFFVFKIGKDTITKIGQYPSSADLESIPSNEYIKILGKEKLFEFKRALGLFSFGVGIGSFVYLRRILEFLIETAATKAKHNDNWDETKFKKSDFKEKVKLLRDFLPPFLLQNIELYSILSKGVHALSEEECKSYFPIMKTSIELILDEIVDEKKKEQKKNSVAGLIDNISNKLK